MFIGFINKAQFNNIMINTIVFYLQQITMAIICINSVQNLSVSVLYVCLRINDWFVCMDENWRITASSRTYFIILVKLPICQIVHYLLIYLL